MRQKYRAAGGKAPDDNVQTGPSYQRVFRCRRVDGTDRSFGPVRDEDRNSRKVGANDPGRGWANEDRVREPFRSNRGQGFRR